MSKLAQITRVAAQIIFILIVSISISSGEQAPKPVVQTKWAAGSTQPPTATVSYHKAFIINDRLSALRRQPALQATVIRRIRLAHVVFIVGTSKPKSGQPKFCRVAVTRRTRGWILESALAVAGHRGDDQRIMTLIESTDGVDKITLCRILTEHFTKSRLVARAMLLLGEEADRAAETLTQRTRRRLGEVRGAAASLREYYLSDAALDRYSKLGVVFDFNESTAEFVYNGRAYREVARRFPESDEAALAGQRLELASRKMAQQH